MVGVGVGVEVVVGVGVGVVAEVVVEVEVGVGVEVVVEVVVRVGVMVEMRAIKLTLSPEEVLAIDAQRDSAPRATFLRLVVRRALGLAAKVADGDEKRGRK